MEKRENFYNNELNIERVNSAIEYLAENLNLNEIMKVVREISYDMVCYYDKENCGIIYKDNRYTNLNKEQACRIQRGLSTMCDLFAQSIIDKREFNEEYLSKWLDGGYLQEEVIRLRKKLEELKNEED